MADLTLERIAELRVLHEKVRSSGWADAIKAMAEWSLQLRMSSDALLDAAERGLTNGWVKNTETADHPEYDKMLVRLEDGCFRTAVFYHETGEWILLGGDEEEWLKFDAVTHFMVIKEPTDG